MGWTSYSATYYKNGKVDRKAEIDSLFNRDGYSVLKSTMVGTTYYGAVKYLNRQGKEVVFGLVCLTRVDNKDYYNFSYKDMDETMGPYAYDCPKSIIKLLTPTDNEFALKWREKCLNKGKVETTAQKLSKLPVGTRIKFKDWNNEIVECVKRAPAYQFKKPFWMYVDKFNYIKIKNIPDEFEVVTK